MQRRALMLLAVGDRLNAPLQTLVLSANIAIPHLPAPSAARVRGAIDRLVAVSRELANLDIVREQRQSFDARGELRYRI